MDKNRLTDDKVKQLRSVFEELLKVYNHPEAIIDLAHHGQEILYQYEKDGQCKDGHIRMVNDDN